MKKKNIKEPRFWKYFVPVLIPAILIASVICVYFYSLAAVYVSTVLSSENNTSKEQRDKAIDLYYSNQRNGGSLEKEYREALAELYFAESIDYNCYFEYYIGSERLFSTKTSALASWADDVYKLTDDPEVISRCEEAFGNAKIGKDIYWKTCLAGQVAGSLWRDSNDPPGIGSKLIPVFLGITDTEDLNYPGTIIDIYLDKERMEFYPGRVEVWDIYGNSSIVDLTPADTSDLICKSKDAEVHGFPYYFFSILLATHSDEGIISDETRDLVTSNGNPYSVRCVRYDVPSLLSICPVQITAAVLIVCAICVLTAFLIARYKYNKVRAVYDVLEYRRKTTDAMAHDLKTPLAILSAYADNMKDETDPDKIKEYSSKMQEHVMTANRMLEDILYFSRSESGVAASSSEEVSLKTILDRSVSERSDLFKASDIKVVISGNDILLKTDPKLITQAIDNLISNCADHATAGTVDITLDSNTLKIRNKTDLNVKDVNELRKPFVKGATSRGESGTGLGLSVADNDLEILGYKLELELKDGYFTATVRF